jgi:hypothetical protein
MVRRGLQNGRGAKGGMCFWGANGHRLLQWGVDLVGARVCAIGDGRSRVLPTLSPRIKFSRSARSQLPCTLPPLEGNAPEMFPELVSVLRTLGLSDEQSIADLETLAQQADQVREVARGREWIGVLGGTGGEGQRGT